MNNHINKWIDVCSINDLVENSGVCALVESTQVALFYIPNDNAIYAINNLDPFSLINVLSRGLIGDIKGEIMVSSPIYKQHFSLETGICFEDNAIKVDSYSACIEADRVKVNLNKCYNE